MALASVLQMHAQLTANLETSHIKDGAATEAGAPEQPPATPAVSRSAAYFLGTDASPSLTNGIALDDARLAAYQAIAAKARIQSNPSCQSFFHYEGERVLENTRFSMQYLGFPKSLPK